MGLRSDRQGPNTIGALKEWLAPEQQIATTDDSSSATPDQKDDLEEFHTAPRIQDLFDPDDEAREATLQEGITTNDVVGQRPAATAAVELHAPKPLRENLQRSSPPVASRVLRTVALGVLAIALAGVAFALLSEDVGQRDNKSQSAVSDTQPLKEEPSPVLQQRLDTLADDLATVRRITEQLSARVEKTTQDLATLRASEQNLSQQVTALTQVQQSASRPQRLQHSSRRYFSTPPSRAGGHRPASITQ